MADKDPILVQVKNIEEIRAGIFVEIHGQQQVFTLAAKTENFEYFVKLLQRSRDRNRPVGVAVGENSIITSVKRSDSDHVQSITQGPNKEVWIVRFQGHNGLYFISESQENFGELKSLLEQALQKTKRIWFIVKPEGLNITDLRIREIR